jgi:hypothetical protein
MADVGPSVETMAFAEGSGPLLIPGPLIRVPSGTEVRVSVRNRLTVPLVIHGLTSRPASSDDSLIVPPHGTREARFRVNEPGTYYYWGTTTGLSIADRDGLDSQLSGAIIVDSPAAAGVAPDRVFMIGVWFGPPTPALHTVAEPEIMAINGKSWPHTEQFTFIQVTRFIGAGSILQPALTRCICTGSISKWRAAATGAGHLLLPDRRPREVTELMLPWHDANALGSERTGNWLFHCHFSFTSRPTHPFPIRVRENLAAGGSGHPAPPSNERLGAGTSRDTWYRYSAAQPPPQRARDIRLLWCKPGAPVRPYPGYGYVIQTVASNPPATRS